MVQYTKGMENNYHSFEDLLIWQEGMKLCDEIYAVLKKLRTQIYIAMRQGYIEKQKGLELVDLAKKIAAMISNFISVRKNRIRKPGK